MSDTPKISDAEWEVMKILWEDSPLPSAQIVEKVQKTQSWEPKTVKTLITRLVKKEAVGFHDNERKYYYFPKASQEECIRTEAKSFMDKFRNGMVRPLLTAFLEDEDLTKEDFEELSRILAKKKKRKKG